MCKDSIYACTQQFRESHSLRAGYKRMVAQLEVLKHAHKHDKQIKLSKEDLSVLTTSIQ